MRKKYVALTAWIGEMFVLVIIRIITFIKIIIIIIIVPLMIINFVIFSVT
jgi:hypothetical protein